MVRHSRKSSGLSRVCVCVCVCVCGLYKRGHRVAEACGRWNTAGLNFRGPPCRLSLHSRVFVYSLRVPCCVCSKTAVSGKKPCHAGDIREGRAAMWDPQISVPAAHSLSQATPFAHSTRNVLPANVKVLLGKHKVDMCWCVYLKLK